MNDSTLRRFGLLLGLLLCLLSLAAPAQPAPDEARAAVLGRILDAETADPIYLVEVTLMGTGRQIRTDREGRFAFRGILPGTYSIRAARLGYEDLIQDGVRAGAGTGLSLDLSMVPGDIPLEEITVTPGTFAFMKRGGSVRQTMSREEIESVPQLGEDVFRAVNRLPGLSSGDYSAHFSIRGGRHDETLILLDGLELYEPYHLKDFNEGAISIIDVETIEGVELMTGGFPARYGNKRSGVFNVTSRRPAMDKAWYKVGLSFMNARATAMGPLGNSRGSWLASARSGYMDLVFGLINQDELPSPRYHDVFAKLDVDVNSRHTLLFDVMHAGDKYEFDATSTTGFLDSLDSREFASNSYGNSYVWTTLESALGERTMVRTMLSAGLVTRNRDGNERVVDAPEPIYRVTNERDFSIFGVKQDWTHRLADAYVLGYGVDFRRLHNTDTFTSVVEQDPNDPSPDPDETFPVRTDFSTEETGTLLGLYLSNRLRILDPLVLDIGGRYDRASYTDDSEFSPRLSAALTIGPGRTLRASWGHYRQIQGIDDVATLNEDTSYYAAELTEQWTVGVEQLFANGAVLRVEGYYKEGSDLRPQYRNWKGGIDTFPESNEDRLLVFPDKTTSKGLEIYYDQKLSRRTAVRASYALSFADEEVSRIDNVNGAEPVEFDPDHSIPMDQRHAANLDWTYQVARAWTLTASFAFHSGWPATLEEFVPITREDGEPDFTIRPQKIYGERLPHYRRLDVRATRRWTTERGDWSFFVELVNLTNHSNIFGYDYFKSRDPSGEFILEREEESWFTILPSIGATWSGSF